MPLKNWTSKTITAALIAALLLGGFAYGTDTNLSPAAASAPAVYKNFAPLTPSIPMTNNASTAPQTVVARLTVPLLAGQVVIVTSKVQARVLMTYNTGVSGYVRVVHPDSTTTAITRAMGYNAHVGNVKYPISHGVAIFVAEQTGDHAFEHLLYAYSTAYVPGHVVDVSYCDQQAYVLPADNEEQT